jgi:hypothetical protein
LQPAPFSPFFSSPTVESHPPLLAQEIKVVFDKPGQQRAVQALLKHLYTGQLPLGFSDQVYLCEVSDFLGAESTMGACLSEIESDPLTVPMLCSRLFDMESWRPTGEGCSRLERLRFACKVHLADEVAFMRLCVPGMARHRWANLRSMYSEVGASLSSTLNVMVGDRKKEYAMIRTLSIT